MECNVVSFFAFVAVVFLMLGCFVILLELSSCEIAVIVCDVFCCLLRVRVLFRSMECNIVSFFLLDAFLAIVHFLAVPLFAFVAVVFLMTGCFVLLLDFSSCEIVIQVCDVFSILLSVCGLLRSMECDAVSFFLLDAFWAIAHFLAVPFFAFVALDFLLDDESDTFPDLTTWSVFMVLVLAIAMDLLFIACILSLNRRFDPVLLISSASLFSTLVFRALSKHLLAEELFLIP